MTSDILMQESIMFACLTALIGFVLWLFFRRKQTQTHLEYHRLEVLNKMIDKYGTSGEFISFMQTEAGIRLLQPGNGAAPGGRTTVLRFVQVAVMVFVLGAGFMAASSTYANASDPNDLRKALDMEYWGQMCFFMAIGLGIVSVITSLFNKQNERRERRLAQKP